MTSNNEKEMMRMLTKTVNTLQKVDERLSNLEAGQAEIKEDISEIKSEIKLINKKITIIDGDNRGLRSRIEILEDKIQPSN